MTENKKPVCKLIGTDGNAFAIIGQVAKTLRLAGQDELAKKFTSEAFKAGSYDILLMLCFDYVDVE